MTDEPEFTATEHLTPAELDRAAELLRKLRPDLTFPAANPEQSDILVAYCPERILPGQTLRELVDNARVVGGLDRRSAQRAKELYSCFAMGPMKTTTARVAELSIKNIQFPPG